jgi:hypothetical protein
MRKCCTARCEGIANRKCVLKAEMVSASFPRGGYNNMKIHRIVIMGGVLMLGIGDIALGQSHDTER